MEAPSILVTGATGRLGSRVVGRLRELGHPVICLVRKGSAYYWLNPTGARYRFGDLKEPDLDRLFVGVDRLVVCSGLRVEGRSDHHVNVTFQGHQRLFRAARSAGVRRALFVSCLGVGRSYPSALYDNLARAEESLRSSGMEHVILRPSLYSESLLNVVRVTQKIGFLPVFGPGKAPVSPISLDDIATFVVRALQDPGLRDRVIEAGGPETMELRQAMDRALDLASVPARQRRLIHIPRTSPLLSLLSRRLGHRVQDLEIEAARDLSAPPSELFDRFSLAACSLEQALERELHRPIRPLEPSRLAHLESLRSIEATRYEPGRLVITGSPSDQPKKG